MNLDLETKARVELTGDESNWFGRPLLRGYGSSRLRFTLTCIESGEQLLSRGAYFTWT